MQQSALASILLLALTPAVFPQSGKIGREVGMHHRLQDGDEFTMPALELINFGRKLFTAVWTPQEGGGRPMSKGTGDPISDPSAALVFPRNVNRISGPDSNSCAGCHALPYPGGGGDIVANVFVLGQRFDSVTFAGNDSIPTKSS